MNITTILDLIAERETAAGQTADRLRQQITTLTAELTHIDSELADLATTRTTLQALTAAEFTAEDPTIASAPYQQILAVLHAASTGMRAKDICIAVGVERPLVARRVRAPRTSAAGGFRYPMTGSPCVSRESLRVTGVSACHGSLYACHRGDGCETGGCARWGRRRPVPASLAHPRGSTITTGHPVNVRGHRH